MFVMSDCPSVRPRGTTRLPLDGFLYNLIFTDISKIGRENSSFNILRQEWWVPYIKTYVHLWYLAEFFLKWDFFRQKFVKKTKTRILCSLTFLFQKAVPFFWDNVGKYGTHGDATDDNIIRRMHFTCWTTKATHTQNMPYLVLFHGKNGYKNTLQCDKMRAQPLMNWSQKPCSARQQKC